MVSLSARCVVVMMAADDYKTYLSILGHMESKRNPYSP